jgi:FtsP/CotA-like multicopper oxidase with cupredoxin domain
MISRREALARSVAVVVGVGGRRRLGFLSLTGVDLGAGPFRPESSRTPALKDFSLTVSAVRWELGPGRVVDAYAYNAAVPGPALRVTEGDTVRVRVTNALAEPTTIHWHGVEVPSAMDGVPGLSQPPIAPGDTFTYEFVATRAGTRWYHPHINELAQTGGGLAGPLIIEPREPSSVVQREYVIVAQQWPDPSAQRPHGDPAQSGMSGMKGGDSTGQNDGFTVNGKAYPSGAPLVVRQGERVRLRLINAGTTATQVFALAGHGLVLTHTDGNPLSLPIPVDAVPLGVGERADVEFVASNPGRWQLGSIASGQADRGLGIDVVYEGHETDAVQFPAVSDVHLTDYSAMTGGPLPTARPDRTLELVLSQDRSSGEWTINGAAYPAIAPIDVRPGERVRVRLINMSMEDHPMHLHGHTVQIVAIGERPVAGPFKDTVTLGHMDSYDLEFLATNPGRWLFHCHNLMHMAGMMTEVRYQKGVPG